MNYCCYCYGDSISIILSIQLEFYHFPPQQTIPLPASFSLFRSAVPLALPELGSSPLSTLSFTCWVIIMKASSTLMLEAADVSRNGMFNVSANCLASSAETALKVG